MEPELPIQTESKLRFYVFQDERFVDLNLYQFGWEHCRPMHQFGPAVCNHFLFHYILSGTGKLETSGQTFFLKPGQGFLLCPGRSAPTMPTGKTPGSTPGWSLTACGPESA